MNEKIKIDTKSGIRYLLCRLDLTAARRRSAAHPPPNYYHKKPVDAESGIRYPLARGLDLAYLVSKATHPPATITLSAAQATHPPLLSRAGAPGADTKKAPPGVNRTGQGKRAD